jgi:hypothetical protein
MNLPTTRLVGPDGREGIVNEADVARLLAEGWTRPGAAPAPKPAAAPAPTPRATTGRITRSEPLPVSEADPS